MGSSNGKFKDKPPLDGEISETLLEARILAEDALVDRKFGTAQVQAAENSQK